MSRFRDIDEGDLERLLAGRAPAEAYAFEGVANFISDLRTAWPEQPVPEHVEAEHVAAMIAEAQLPPTFLE